MAGLAAATLTAADRGFRRKPGLAAWLVLFVVVPTIGEVIFNQFISGRNQPFGAALGTLLPVIFVLALRFTRGSREEE
ncbi:MAG: hypothetical protein WC076_07780 [Terrimicrobiaceae bacterium]